MSVWIGIQGYLCQKGHCRVQQGRATRWAIFQRILQWYKPTFHLNLLLGVRVAFSPADKDPNHFVNPFELDMYDYDPLNDVLMRKPSCSDNCTNIPNPQLVNPQGAK